MIKFSAAILGFIFLAIGAIGVAIPVLPTTPFVLLASGCFAYGSERMYTWLSNTKYFGEFIENYKNKTGVTIKTKIFALSFLYITIGFSLYFIDLIWVKLLLLLIVAGVTIHILMLKKRKK